MNCLYLLLSFTFTAIIKEKQVHIKIKNSVFSMVRSQQDISIYKLGVRK